jgi:hypothetical protein
MSSWLLGSLVLSLLVVLAFAVAQNVPARTPPEGLPNASSVHAVILQAATRAGIATLIDGWLRNSSNKTKRLIGAVQVSRDSASYEVIGSRGVEIVYTAVISYAE